MVTANATHAVVIHFPVKIEGGGTVGVGSVTFAL